MGDIRLGLERLNAGPRLNVQAAPNAGAPAPKKRAKAKASAPKAKKAKPPCKYGPRDADGYCPKKPPAAKRAKKAPLTEAQKFQKRAVDSQINALSSAAGSIAARATDAGLAKVRAAGGVRAVAKKVGSTPIVLTPGMLKAAQAAGKGAVGIVPTAAIAVIAGLASYYATTWLIDQIGRSRDPAVKAVKTALALRKARADAQKQLGRPLTAAEVKELHTQFYSNL